MEIHQLTNQLASLTGYLHSSSAKDEKEIEKLQAAIANAIVNQDPSTIRSKEFVFERSDLFHTANIESNRLKKINELAKLAGKGEKQSDTNVFVRNIPIRSTQIAGSITSASAGVRVKSFGPIIDKNRKPVWFDFVKVKKLIALYVQGQNMPMILFDSTFKKGRIVLPNSKPVELTKTYKVEPETVWIHGKVFSTDVPDNLYCGLRVKSGSVVLDTDPTMVNNKITVTNATKITVSLNLEQNETFETDKKSPFGIDARNADFNLPNKFQFTFKNNAKTIAVLSDAKWNVYGQKSKFTYQNSQVCIYNSAIGRVAIPVKCDSTEFEVSNCKSPFFTLEGKAKIKNSWWALSVTNIDIANPLEADGNGAIIVECEKGLDAKWTNLQNKSVSFVNPFILGEPGRINITDVLSDGSGTFQNYIGWNDEQNVFGTTIECKYNKNSLLVFNTVAKGDELIFGFSDWNIKTDRPVKVNGEAVTVKTKNSAFALAVSKVKSTLTVFDENMLWDNKLPADKIPKVKPYALAMHNALFTVTPPNSIALFAEATPDLKALTKGQMYLGFGLYSYLPTLPDPYAANLGLLRRQFEIEDSRHGMVSNTKRKGSVVWLWLIGLVKWEPKDDSTFKVGVSFHFAPLATPLEIEKDTNDAQSDTQNSNVITDTKKDIFSRFSNDSKKSNETLTNLKSNISDSAFINRNPLAGLNLTDFSLVDVSSKANQMGISYAKQNNFLQETIARQYKIDITGEDNATVFPVQVSGLDVITAGMNAQAFTVPSISWEPVFNLTKPELEKGDVDNNNVPLPPPYDPPVGFNYYQNDGIATRVGNLSKKQVPLSPIPMAKFLVETYKTKDDGKTFAVFNLPFGMLAITILDNKSTQQKLPNIDNPKPIFENYINGGLQLELTAGTSFAPDDEGNMFEGYTIQLVNINNVSGIATDASTLAGTPTQIFNNEFFTNSSNLPARPGVPITGIGLSGYGASMVSEWENKEALFAQTSQAQFNVVTGRTNHEVVQVKSMLYPWGIRVVRTITLFRLANGYVARIDSGWKAESDGKYDFSYNEPIFGPDGKTVIGKTPIPNPFEFHPGIVRGLFNVRNIKEQPKIFEPNVNTKLYAVTFDADVQLENVSEGGDNNRVPSHGIIAYVQIEPAGEPIGVDEFSALIKSENNSIGGPVNCILKVAGSSQRMKISRFDLSATVDSAANKAIFVSAARGSVIMPKDGSWTMVQHNRGTGDVSPLPEQLSVPLIRIGKWVKDKVVSDADVSNLLRIAHPEDLLKFADSDTINFGFLQNMGTQKVLFMTPGFKKGIDSLLSKTPPLLADSFRLLNSKGIFPNIGDIDSNFGQAISLLKGIGAGNNPLDAFNKINLADAGDVLNVLQLKAKEEAGKLLDQGYELAKGAVNGVADKAIKFDLPSFDYPLVDLDGKLVIAIQYKASSKPKGQPQKNYVGKFDFDVDSFAGDLADTWKGRMNNLAMVVSIGPLTDVMTIKGNFNSQKGKETDLGSDASNNPLNLPKPEIEFSDALEPVIKILEILASLSSGEYGDALKKGLKIAMSNSANIWEYKFEASKDIPLVRFPPTKALYESPSTPLKLEASLGIGVSFNAALKVTSDPSQLLPTAGGYFEFHGGLQVMCVSVGVGTIYAVGNVDLKLEADTSPKVGVTLKFGFGAQITVGLPVVGHASILFMVGVEIYADSGSVVKITAFMLFRGQAELLGGIVSVTITIEAKGSVEKIAPTPAEPNPPANCKAQVTFAIDISIFLVIDISFSESWEETRQIA